MEKFKSVMSKVYGDTTKGSVAWTPKPYKEGKGRYLWTDAFGVCNFITLYRETKDSLYLDLADGLISAVHDSLGKDRALKNRLGDSTEEHPLRGGLRIGKEDDVGPDCDGQYFHYLTKWMFALNRMSLVRNAPHYNDWAVELAKAIHPRFVYDRASPRPHMHWKMSIDLSRPLVHSEGNLDPLDGYVTYRLLSAAHSDKTILKDEIADLKKIVDLKWQHYRSTDPLDLGEALWICHWFPDEEWAAYITEVSLNSLEELYDYGYFSRQPSQRLAFREFGTTIGTQVTKNPSAKAKWNERIYELHNFWEQNLYTRDSDITPVMFCTSLCPGAFTNGYLD
eukprot:237391_1